MKTGICLLFLMLVAVQGKLVWRTSDELFYFDASVKLDYTHTLDMCAAMGGRVPMILSTQDADFLSRHAVHPEEGTWLWASKARGGYRWSDADARFIDSNLWAPEQPDCSGPCAVVVRSAGSLFAVHRDTVRVSPTCTFDVSSDIQLQKLLDHWRSFASADQQSLVEYVLKRKTIVGGSSSNGSVSVPPAAGSELRQLLTKLDKLADAVQGTNEQVGQLRDENKKTVASFKKALQVSLASLDTHRQSLNATDLISLSSA